MANSLVQEGLRKSTRSTYSSAQETFIRFCDRYGLVAVPVSEKTILRFISHLYAKKVSHGTIKVYLAAVRNLNVLSGHEVTIWSYKVKLAVKAVQSSGPPPVKKKPIMYSLLCLMCAQLSNRWSGLMLKAALSTAFFAGLRGGEYTISGQASTSQSLTVAHVSFDKVNMTKVMRLKIPRSKTRVHGITCSVGCSGQKVCAVCDMESYMALRSASSKLQSNQALFQFQNGEILSKSKMNQAIKELVSGLGLNPSEFSTHSLRAGVASEAAARGFKEWELKSLGNWSSNAYMGYVRDKDNLYAGFAKRLAMQ